MAIRLDQKIDLSDPSKLKIANEQETRRKFLAQAKALGYEYDLIQIFNKFDKLMRLAKDDKERADISKLGAFEVFKLLGKNGDLYVNGELIYQDKDLIIKK